MARLLIALSSTILLAFLGGCSSSGGGAGDPPHTLPYGGQYTVFAWNDLGMHCLNPSYDTLVILPPYNTVWAQVVKRGNPPTLVTQGLTVSYHVVDNTSSYGKRSYGQFWDYITALFGTTLEHDKGLNLEDPGVHNGLSGAMLAKGDHFQANGIPVVPVNDAQTWDPYQVIEVVVTSGTDTVASTRATIPTSDEIDCAKCHGTNAFRNILSAHDSDLGTSLLDSVPVLCAKCHGSPALGQSGRGSSGMYLSEAIHSYHASKGAACYDCHPGAVTQCSRSLAHTSANGNCISCHDSLRTMAASISAGTKVPWVNEPSCTRCHSTSIAQVATGDTLYRNAMGHGNMRCAACHGSPHAQVPTRKASDNYQAVAYMGKAVPMGSCAACHGNSHGDGYGEFNESHGSSGERSSACNVCHTGFTALSQAKFPHAFGWTAR